MKTFFLFIGMALLSQYCYSQNLQHQDFIVEFLGQDRFDRIQASNPSYLVYLDTRCSYGYIIVDYVDEKMSQMNIPEVEHFIKITKQIGKDSTGVCKDGIKKELLKPLQFLASAENGTLNILAFDFEYKKSEVTYYRIGDTGKMIAIYPAEYISKKVNSNH